MAKNRKPGGSSGAKSTQTQETPSNNFEVVRVNFPPKSSAPPASSPQTQPEKETNPAKMTMDDLIDNFGITDFEAYNYAKNNGTITNKTLQKALDSGNNNEINKAIQEARQEIDEEYEMTTENQNGMLNILR